MTRREDRMPDMQTPWELYWWIIENHRRLPTKDLFAGIAARDAAIRRDEREKCAKAAESDAAHHSECGHGPNYMDGRHDAAAAIRAREPGAVGSSTTPAMGSAAIERG